MSDMTVEAARAWLVQYKDEHELSWPVLATQMGAKAGTLSVFAGAKYGGDNEGVAQKISRFRSTIEAQHNLSADAPEVPGFVETRTAAQIKRLLTWAHRGKLVAIAGGPGLGKTTASKDYAAHASNVWRIEIAESCASLNAMQVELLDAMGQRDATGTPQRLSRRIREKVRDAKGLIILDEAQKLTDKAIEEARSWADLTDVGLAFIGTQDIITRLGDGARKAAQLHSRVSMRMERAVPLVDDAHAIAAAWGVSDAKEIDFVTAVATRPGGLRSATMALELATMLAIEDGRRTLTHIRDAWKQLSTRPIGA